jgi:protein involved in polysaccharide export with SLBB domain
LNLNAVLAGDAEQNILLQPGDFVTVRRVQDWEDQLTVFLDGEVRYPGTYSFHQGETLLSVLQRAGGLSDHAFPEGSVFLREGLREREQRQLAALRERMRSDIATISLQAATSLESTSVMEAQSVGSALLASLNAIDATGRLVIDLPAILAGESRTPDVLLKDGDTLLIPKRTQAVTVIGEVQFSTSHLYDPGLKRNEYIGRSGGLAPSASKKGIYVVRANGAVIADGGAWGKKGAQIQPGDTIVVPLDTQRGFKLQAWASITQIAYNAAIAVAAINGLN